MKLERTICPKCGKEVSKRTDIDIMYEYSETITYKKCSECREIEDTPEERLVDSILGRGGRVNGRSR